MTTPASEPLFGRDSDLSTLRALLLPGARLTVVGPAGVGKSALLRALASEHGPQGLRWCDLGSARSLADARQAIAAVLGPSERDRSSLGTALLVLDGADALGADALEEVARQLRTSPEVAVVLASRRPTGWPEEQLVRLGPLAPSDATALFVARVRRRDAGWHPSNEETHAIQELVQRLDGLPLALELAAARRTVLSAGEMIDALHDRFQLLRPLPGAPQRALWDVLVETWDALIEPCRALLAQCTVFRGGFTLAAVRAVCVTDGFLPDLLQHAVDSNVLRTTTDPFTGTTRFVPYESVREFAQPFLLDPDTICERHARWAEDHVESCERRIVAGPVDAARHAVAVERFNIGAAFDYLLPRAPERALALAVGGSRAAALDAPMVWLERMDAAAARVRDLGPPLKIRAAAARAGMWFDAGRSAVAVGVAQAALREADDWPEHRCRLRRIVAMGRHRSGQTEGGVELLRGALEDGRATGCVTEVAAAQLVLAGVCAARGEPEESARWSMASRATARDSRDKWAEAAAVAAIAGDEAEPAMRRARSEEALALARAAGHRMVTAVALGNLAKGDLSAGDPASAQRRAAEGLDAAAAWPFTLRWLLAILGGALVDLGRTDEADVVLARAERQFVESQPRDRAGLCYERAEWHLARGELPSAIEALRLAAQAQSAEVSLRLAMVLAPTAPAEASALLASIRVSVEESPTWRSLIDLAQCWIDAEPVALAASVAALREPVGWVADPTLGRPIAKALAWAAVVGPVAPLTLEVFASARRYRLADVEVDLSRRGPQRKILCLLAERHASGLAADLYDLFEAGWPDERASHALVTSRVYNAVQRLRDSGLRGVLLQSDEGYFLDPTLQVEFAHGTT